MTCVVVRALEGCVYFVEPAWTSLLLKFLSLCEKFPTTESPPHPGSIALRILSRCSHDNFDATHIPTLASMLSPDHPLQSRKLALAAFCRFAPQWFSPQMETVSGHRLNRLLQAVGDPLRFPPEPLQDQDGELERTTDYEPMEVVVVLIEFASSELWQSHLHPSNFASCEDIASTDDTLRRMFGTALKKRPGFLCTPTEIVAAIRRLEELQCLHTAQVVIMWAWITGMADTMEQDGWKLVGGETLRFYRAHGTRSLAALKWCIINGDLKFQRTKLFAARYEGPPFRVRRSRRPSNLSYYQIPYQEEWATDCVISQACRLRRLYHLFGYDPTTWEEAVGAGEANEKREAIPKHSATPDPFVGWECDYP